MRDSVVFFSVENFNQQAKTEKTKYSGFSIQIGIMTSVLYQIWEGPVNWYTPKICKNMTLI